MRNLFPLTKPSSTTASHAYADNREYLQDEFKWLNACVSLQYMLVESEDNESEEVFRVHRTLIEEHRDHIRSRVAASEAEGVFLALPWLSRVFELTEIEAAAIMVLLAPELDRKYETAYEELQADNGLRLPTPDFVARLISGTEADWRQVLDDLRPDGLIARLFLRRDRNARQTAEIGRPIQLDPRMVRFLSGDRSLPESMREFASLIRPGDGLPQLMGNDAAQANLRRWLARRAGMSERADASIIVSLYGKHGVGKRTHLAHLGRHFGEPMLFVDVARLMRGGHDFRAMLTSLYREAMLQQAMLALCHFREALEEAEMLRLVPDLLDEIAGFNHIVFLTSEKPCLADDRNRRITLEIELADLSERERLEAWRQASQPYDVDPGVNWEALSARFLFTPGQIVHALRMAEELARWESDSDGRPVIGWRHLITGCYRQLNHQLGGKAKRLTPKHTLDDLILPEPQKQKLVHACNHIKYKHNVYEKWGFYRKFSYGTGISMLFSGPPGTGKTMAAEAIANELDMEIYKVDTSQIISKYIGETEKNLREIFAEAASSYAVLFFDEADAIFGKRSEVKDAHDRYANTEVAFLLQKMEEYNGISILATNYLQNIDEAFMRRINYIIRFPFPDEEQRERIWRGIFPGETPLAPDIDHRFLARNMQLAGGSIKNIAITAAFLASGSGEPVGMKHILKAYQYELEKSNRSLDRKALAEYASYLDEM